MKKVVSTLQQLGQKAQQLQQAVDAAPDRMNRLRDAVTFTAGQIHELRSGVQASVAALRAGTDTDLAAMLTELEEDVAVFAEAGYELAGLDLEPGISPRLTVVFERASDPDPELRQRLAGRHAGRRTTHAVLNALFRAAELAGQVNLPPLAYREVRVELGPTPTLRLGWRRGGPQPQAAGTPPRLPTPPAPTTPPSRSEPGSPPARPDTLASGFGAGSFFEPRPPSPPRPLVPTAPTAPGPAEPAGPPAAAPAPAADWRTDALARFKKMPDLSPRRD